MSRSSSNAAVRRLGRRLALLTCGCALLVVQAGCVQRRLTVRSNPPGALVYIDDYEIGTTPVSTHYTYYGTRKIRLIKDGYETLTVEQPVPAPWYQYFPIEFVTDNLVPWEIRDERVLSYQLVPQVIVPNDQLMSRAENLRQLTRASATGPVTTPPVATPVAPTGPLPLPAPNENPLLVPPGPRSVLPPALTPSPQFEAPPLSGPGLNPPMPADPARPPRSGTPF